MTTTTIRTALAIATAAFISVPIGAHAASATVTRGRGRTRGRAEKLSGRNNERSIEQRTQGIKGKHTQKNPMKGRTPDVRGRKGSLHKVRKGGKGSWAK